MVDQISGPYNWVAKWLERGGSPGAWYACRGTDRAHILMRVVISSLGESEKEQLVRKLLDYGAYSYGIGCEGGDWSLSSLRDLEGWNALFAAIDREYKEIARMLLDKGAGSSSARCENCETSLNALQLVGVNFSRWGYQEDGGVQKQSRWIDMFRCYSPFKEQYEAACKK
jgi:hypothetical protein